MRKISQMQTSIEFTQLNTAPAREKELDVFVKYLFEELERKRELIPGKIATRIEEFLQVLEWDVVNLQQLKQLCFLGIPDDIPGLRSLCWKILMGYLSPLKFEWEAHLLEKRDNYAGFVNEFLIPKGDFGQLDKKRESTAMSPPAKASPPRVNLEMPTPTERIVKPKRELVVAEDKKTESDHPLNKEASSTWASYYKDYELWEVVAKDTKRTRAEMHFFQKPTERPPGFEGVNHKFVNMGKKNLGTVIYETDEETHNEVLQRILFIYSKLNPGVSYVQGMNEVIAPIYYAFSRDANPTFVDYAEADTFWCFTTLMSEIQDSFVRKLDTETSGIKKRVERVHQLLEKCDDEVWLHLERNCVMPIYYCMRWVMLFLTQDLELDDLMTVWDPLLSHANKMEFIEYISVAMVVLKREKILEGDFPEILDTLKKIDDLVVADILWEANELWESMKGAGEKKEVPTVII